MDYLKSLIATLVSVLTSLVLVAQANLDWVKPTHQNARAISFDRNNTGEFIFGGSFTSSVTIDTLITDQFGAFIYKTDPNGNILWSKEFSGSGNDHINDVKFDLDGNRIQRFHGFTKY